MHKSHRRVRHLWIPSVKTSWRYAFVVCIVGRLLSTPQPLSEPTSTTQCQVL